MRRGTQRNERPTQCWVVIGRRSVERPDAAVIVGAEEPRAVEGYRAHDHEPVLTFRVEAPEDTVLPR